MRQRVRATKRRLLIKMATRRFVLYTDTQEQQSVLASWMKSQTHVQLVSQLAVIPAWLQPLQRPVLVDMLTQEAVWGTEIQTVMNSRKPPSKFAAVEELD